MELLEIGAASFAGGHSGPGKEDSSKRGGGEGWQFPLAGNLDGRPQTMAAAPTVRRSIDLFISFLLGFGSWKSRTFITDSLWRLVRRVTWGKGGTWGRVHTAWCCRGCGSVEEKGLRVLDT